MTQSVSNHVVAAMFGAMSKHNDIQKKWIGVMHKLSGSYGVVTTMLFQSDYRIDLILRSMESEASLRISSQNTGDIDYSFDMQSALSRYWVLSTYEALRVAKNSELGAGNARLVSLHDKFWLVRMPLAKGEIAGTDRKNFKEEIHLYRAGDEPSTATLYDRKRTDYIMPTLINAESGSIVWQPIDPHKMAHVEISRIELSNEFLTLFD